MDTEPKQGAAEATAAPGEVSFVRALGLFSAAALVAGAMIGSGIFIVSQDMADKLGSPVWLLAAWIVTGLMTIMVSLSYAELASMYPQAGGQYVYLREAFSPLWGFLYGWSLFVVIQTGSIAAVGVAFAKYLGVLVPGVSTQAWLLRGPDLHLGAMTVPLGVNTAQLVAIGVIVALTANNCVNIHAGKWVQNVFTVAKVASLLALIGVGLFFGREDAALRADDILTARDSSDAYGNPTSIVVDSGGGYSKTTTNTYDNITDANRWFLGRLRRSTVNSVTP